LLVEVLGEGRQEVLGRCGAGLRSLQPGNGSVMLRAVPEGNCMNPPTPLFAACSRWLYCDLLQSTLHSFANLTDFRQNVSKGTVGCYAIWLKLAGWEKYLCLKVGLAICLRRRISEHRRSRELPTPNILAAHLMTDTELEGLSGVNLRDRLERRQFIQRLCYFQVVAVRPDTPHRELAILECRLAAELEPRYIHHCGGYPDLEPFIPGSLQPGSTPPPEVCCPPS
jgi:hypothetical protein